MVVVNFVVYLYDRMSFCFRDVLEELSVLFTIKMISFPGVLAKADY